MKIFGSLRSIKIALIFVTLLSVVFSNSVDLLSIFQSDSEEQEVYLSFRYQGGVNTVIIAYMKGESYYLPISQVFTLLKINHTIDNNALAIKGYYIDKKKVYRIGLKSRVIQLGPKRWEISSDDFLIKELDYYIRAQILEEIFSLRFIIDINRLVLKLETQAKLPIVAQYERRKKRQSEFQSGLIGDELSYEIISNRNRHVLNGAYLDYSFFSRFAGIGNMYNYRVQFGNELLFGDFQGAFLGNHTLNNSSYSLSGLRWRYVFAGGNDIEQVYLGENTSTGIGELPYTGLRITNEPVDPLKAYDLYILDGTTNPESEVELYENNRLIEYQKADEKGYYRFTIPLSYGSSNIRLRIYNPTGGIETIEKRIQVPYTFLPTGKVYYNIHIGRGSDRFTPWNERPALIQSDIGYGLTNWLTARSGIEYVESSQSTKPIFFQAVSFRFLGQFLGNVNIAPGSFYSASTDIITPNQRSLNVAYNYYPENSIYDQSEISQNISIGTYFPFTIGQLPITIQLSPSFEQRDNGEYTQGLSWDIATQLKRLRIRSGFRDRGVFGNPFGRGTYSTALMFTIPRTSAYPKLVRGLYMRGETSYSLTNGIGEISLQFLRQVSRKSRFRFLLRKRPDAKGLQFELGFTFDFDKTRQTTNYRKLGEDYIFTYSVRGSVGFHSLRNRYYTNRNQVGRSSVGVRLFVDENNSGTYDNNEEILTGKAIRLVKASGQMEEKNGVTVVTQLQPYKQYNFVVNKANIKNPTLSPKVDAFAVITDPNQMKQVDIPLYVTGIIEGQVVRIQNDRPQPLAGLRINLKQQNGDYETTITTFYDGSYYAMEIPPGTYTVTIDENQLAFLNVEASPVAHYIEIKALAEGDFVEGLDFILTTKNQ